MKASGKSRNILLMTFIVLLLLGMTSCFDSKYDFDNISDEMELTPGISVPLAFGSLTLEDILNEADSTGDYVRRFDEDSLLYLIYSQHLLSNKATDIITLPDQDFLQFFIDSDVATAGFLTVAKNDTASSTKSESGEFKFSNGERLDSMNLKSVLMHIDVSSSFHHKGILIIYSDSIFVGGKKFRKEIQISSADGSFSKSLDTTLTNVKLILDNSNPDTTFLPIKYDLNLINSGASVLSSERCDIDISFRDNVFTSLFGYLGKYDLLVSKGAVDITLFNELKGGNLYFADPELSITMNNSFGIPANLELKNFEGVSKITNSTKALTFNGVNPFEILYPDIDHFREKVYSEIPINKENSNIDEVIQILPHHFYYDAIAETNPLGPSGPYNFVTDSSQIDLGIQVILPIWIKAEGFSLTDTMEFDFEKEIGSDIDKIDYFRLSMDVTNGLPIEANIQAYFTDASYNKLDSLFKNDLILLDPAQVGPDDKVTMATNHVSKVEYTTAEIEKIKPSKYIIIKALANTPTSGSGYFKFHSFYSIDFKLSAKVDFHINSNDF